MSSSADTKLIENQLDTSWLIDRAPCALFAVDERHAICFANIAAEQLFEYASGELLGKQIDLLIAWPPQAKAQTAANSQLEPWRPGNGCDVSGVKKNGNAVHLELSIAHAHSLTGPIAIVALAEMTERTRREQALTRSNRDLEQFAYIASHDLREPLRMVSSFLGLLVQRYKDQLDKDAQRYIHFAVDGANRMQRLIDGLLAYARVGSQQNTLAPVDSGSTLRAAWLNLAQVVKETGAQIEYDALPVVHADGKLLQQLFHNLLDNCLKFRGDQPPHICVSARLAADTAIISFKDNGIGFDMKNREKVFEVFRRLHEIGKYEGAGMGLAIAKRIVELCHGTIDVEAAPNVGCTFHVTLPLRG